MTEEDVINALSTLGIRLEPAPCIGDNAQYASPDDPARQDRGSVTIEECRLLAERAAGKNVLEIGTGLGVATVCMATTAQSVTTVDPNEWVRSTLVLPENVTKVASVDDINGAKYRFDFAFIDGLHTTGDVAVDIIKCRGRVRPGGFIGFHDMGQIGPIAAVGMFEWASKKEYPTLGTLTFCEIPL